MGGERYRELLLGIVDGDGAQTLGQASLLVKLVEGPCLENWLVAKILL